jgi:hypothetical protein
MTTDQHIEYIQNRDPKDKGPVLERLEEFVSSPDNMMISIINVPKGFYILYQEMRRTN